MKTVTWNLTCAVFSKSETENKHLNMSVAVRAFASFICLYSFYVPCRSAIAMSRAMVWNKCFAIEMD